MLLPRGNTLCASFDPEWLDQVSKAEQLIAVIVCIDLLQPCRHQSPCKTGPPLSAISKDHGP